MVQSSTIGELKASGYTDRTVKEELRHNLLARLSTGEPLFPDIVGYESSVIPTLERAVLAGHDVIMLGERGQAKSRLMRYLVHLLDESIPAIVGCELNDHPYRPICAHCRVLVAERGDDTPIEWVGRNARYSEKLATPDTSVADLIGDVDPIRVAEGRYLGDELTIHFGLVPRTNRGILAINELPDLPERIQVSLLNILEERDIQVRGYKIRLPLDIMLIASANPEDYTHRGRIISPLKDRFGTQVRTHYPEKIEDEIRIMDQEATAAPEGIPLTVPHYIKEVLAEFSAELRRSPQVNQRSGVSVRFSIGALETSAASALRRAVINREDEAVVRPSDLFTVLPASLGRVEFETFDEGEEPEVLERSLKRALLEVFHTNLAGEDLSDLVLHFDTGHTIEASDSMGSKQLLDQMPAARKMLGRAATRVGMKDPNEAELASVLEFCLEGLHLNRRLNKSPIGLGGRTTYGGV